MLLDLQCGGPWWEQSTGQTHDDPRALLDLSHSEQVLLVRVIATLMVI